MKSVLMIAYFFPPEGNAGSYRPLRFVRHLSKIGWRTSVIAGDADHYERYDPGLLELVPHETEIVRVRGADLWQAIQSWRGQRIQQRLSTGSPETADQIRQTHENPVRSYLRGIVRIAEACYYQPDLAKPWIGPAIKATLKFCKRKRPDVIWATAGPVSAWIVARQVAQRTALPYVLDLRDPHGLGYYQTERLRPEWLKRKMSISMYQLFKGAQSVIFLFDTVAESYCRAFPRALDPAKIHIIPNGYEGTVEQFASPAADKFTVLYTGTITTYRYDTLLRALALLKKKDPEKANRLCFHFVGEGVEKLARDARACGVAEIVATTGPTTYAEISRFTRESHALLALGRPSHIKGHELVAGAKIFEYLKARRPILGVLPQDETRKVLQRVKVSTLAEVESPLQIASVIREMLNAWLAGDLSSFLPNLAGCESYSAERQIHDLVRALEGAQAPKRFVPGSVQVPRSLHAEIGA